MTVASRCPHPQELQQLLLGRLSLEAVERLERHVEQCGSCCRLLPTLPADDVLVQAMRAQTRMGMPPSDRTAVRDLVLRLRQLRPAVELAHGKHSPGETRPMNTNLDSLTFLSAPQAPDEIGRLGPYRVLKLLGQGGMGMVFLAEDPQLQRTVALKAMLPEAAKKPVARQRFLREARATAKLEHDHIVTIYQVGEDRGVPFLAMQLLKGMSLEDYLKKKQGKTGTPLPVGQIVKLGLEIAKGLAAAHEQGLIHRDIKPANIWLDATAGGRVKILDFGLARAVDGDSHHTTLTQLGTVLGTAAYMAPEQAMGSKVDGRADLFSLGCVLYRLAAGRMPWKGGDAMETLVAISTEPAIPVQELNLNLPPKLAQLIMKLLVKPPDQRPASAKAVVEIIQSIEREHSSAQMQVALPLAEPVTLNKVRHDPAQATGMLVRPPTARKPARRWPLGILAGAAALALLAGVFLLRSVIFVQTETGTLKIETADPDVEVFVKQNGKLVQVLDKKHGTEVTLNAGVYQLELGKNTKNVEISKDKIQIVRDGKAIVTVTKTQPVANLRPKETPPTTKAKETRPSRDRSKDFNNSIGMRMALISSGKFIMGSAPNEPGRSKDPSSREQDRHEVELTKPFYMGAHPVTVGQFRQFVEATSHRSIENPGQGSWSHPKFGGHPDFKQTDDCPVVMVTWNDAVAFCNWLSKKEGKKYRLPTEAEWEYGCRAGSPSAYCFGDDPRQLEDFAWYKPNSGGTTHPVGTRRHNAWGLWDMHGHLWQWTADWYGENYVGPKQDPTGPVSGTSRILRSGNYFYDAELCRCASRKCRPPEYATNHNGFRVACEVE